MDLQTYMAIQEAKKRKKREKVNIASKKAYLELEKRYSRAKNAIFGKNEENSSIYRYFSGKIEGNPPGDPPEEGTKKRPVSINPNTAFARRKYRKELISDLKRHRED